MIIDKKFNEYMNSYRAGTNSLSQLTESVKATLQHYFTFTFTYLSINLHSSTHALE
jgi:hypothetical protein